MGTVLKGCCNVWHLAQLSARSQHIFLQQSFEEEQKIETNHLVKVKSFFNTTTKSNLKFSDCGAAIVKQALLTYLPGPLTLDQT